jgi:alpha-N-acetylglucosamine transferase
MAVAPDHRDRRRPAAAWATLITRSSYLAAVLVLRRSLQLVGSKYPLVVMYTDTLDESALDVFRAEGIVLRKVEYLAPRRNDLKPIEPRFKDTWTKLSVFGLVEYEVSRFFLIVFVLSFIFVADPSDPFSPPLQRVVLLDGDMLVRQNMDELLEDFLPDGFLAAAHACTCNPRKLSHYPPDW